jgi:hypothetical protein
MFPKSSIKQLAISIYKIGLIHSIRVDEAGQVIDGAKRYQAIMLLRRGFFDWKTFRFYKKHITPRTKR